MNNQAQAVRRKGKALFVVPAMLMLSVGLSGCVGSSTYGTGKTQEATLLSDLNNIIPIGSKEKKKPIDFTSRPKLVKPPNPNNLPQPMETSETTSNTNFPEDPETRRQRIRSEASETEVKSGKVSVEELTRRKEGAVYARASTDRYEAGIDTTSSRGSNTLDLNKAKRDRRKVRKEQAELAGIRGAAPRRYLTEPPVTYRTPASTAVAGEIGLDENEKAAGKKKKGFSWRKLNPFN